MSNNLNPFEFIYMGRIFQVEHSNETQKDLQANVITAISLQPGKTFRTYVLDKNKGSVILDKEFPGNPEHTINLKL